MFIIFKGGSAHVLNGCHFLNGTLSSLLSFSGPQLLNLEAMPLTYSVCMLWIEQKQTVFKFLVYWVNNMCHPLLNVISLWFKSIKKHHWFNHTDFSNLTCEVALKSNLIYFRRTHSFCSHFAKNYSSRVNEEKNQAIAILQIWCGFCSRLIQKTKLFFFW